MTTTVERQEPDLRADEEHVCLRLAILADDQLSGYALEAVLGRPTSVQADVVLDRSALARRLSRPCDLLLWYTGRPTASELQAVRDECVSHGIPLCAVASRLEPDVASELCGQPDAGAVLLRSERLTSRELFRTIVLVASGRSVVAPELLQGMLGDDSDARSRLFAELTSDELEVLHLVALGLSNRAIARRLQRGDKRVERQVTALLAKLTQRDDEDSTIHRRTLAARIYLAGPPDPLAAGR